MMATPASEVESGPEKANGLPAEVLYPAGIDPAHYATYPTSDAQGRVVFPDLIPGATYQVRDSTLPRDPGHSYSFAVRKEFSVKPGETLELAEILIEKPRR